MILFSPVFENRASGILRQHHHAMLRDGRPVLEGGERDSDG